MNTVKVSLIQMNSGDDKEANFQKAMGFLDQAIKDKPDVICLPENFLYLGKDDAGEDIHSSYIQSFQKFAEKYKVNIILGSIMLRTGHSHQFSNTCLILDRTGDIFHKYDKMYLFYVNRSDIKVRESDTTVPGNALGLFELDGVRMGVGICYDLRYPEYFQALAMRGAEIIFLPAHFRKKTGSVARDVLTRSRAIENQVFFCACGQTGEQRCGDSQIISFGGESLASIGSEEGVIMATLDVQALKIFRKEFPVLQQVKNFTM